MLKTSCLGFSQQNDDPESPSSSEMHTQSRFQPYLSDFQQIDLSAFEAQKINEA